MPDLARFHPARVLLRRARSADAQPCAEIYLRARQATFPGRGASAFDHDDYGRSVEGDDVWVAELDGRIVGFVSSYPPGNLIRHVFVDPAMQNRGIGSLLLAHARALLDGPARLSCLTANQVACAFYERNGWVPEESWPDGFVVYRK